MRCWRPFAVHCIVAEVITSCPLLDKNVVRKTDLAGQVVVPGTDRFGEAYNFVLAIVHTGASR